MIAQLASPSHSGFEAEDKIARELVRDLHSPNPRIFWADLLFSALVGWGAFAIAVWARPFSVSMLLALVISALALYRGLCFLHEISHMRKRLMPGFETAWNILIGYPLLMPSFVYLGVHQDHHSLSTYGTAKDPEYLPFGHDHRMMVAFALESFLTPAILAVRFLLLAPLGLAVPSFQRWLVRCASSLTMNLRYRREVTPELLRQVRRSSVAILLGWSVPAVLAGIGLLPLRFFAIGFAVSSFASFVNTVRTLGAHRYDSHGDPLSRGEQLLDSVDVPGAWWTELWAPVGLRHHGLHHYFPGVPYHNLAEAYRRLSETLPANATYRDVLSPSLPVSLLGLYRRGAEFVASRRLHRAAAAVK